MPPTGASVGGVLRFAPFGVPVVPLVRMMIDACLLALGAGDLLLRAISSASVSSVLPDGSSASGLVPSARSLPSVGFGLADRFGVFVVVDDHLGALALRDLFDLRAGEFAVEQDDAGPRPGRRRSWR